VFQKIYLLYYGINNIDLYQLHKLTSLTPLQGDFFLGMHNSHDIVSLKACWSYPGGQFVLQGDPKKKVLLAFEISPFVRATLYLMAKKANKNDEFSAMFSVRFQEFS